MAAHDGEDVSPWSDPLPDFPEGRIIRSQFERLYRDPEPLSDAVTALVGRDTDEPETTVSKENDDRAT